MQSQRQNLVQQQRLTLSPRLVQSIKLMAMPLADLRERIYEEVEQNPALEILEDPVLAPMKENSAPVKEDGRFDSTEWFENSSDSGYGGDEASDEHRDFIEGVLQRPETLQQHLLEQLALLKIPAPVFTLAELLIQNLDRDGFHEVPPEELLQQSGAQSAELLETALEVVRQLDPPGCACRDFHESLVVQAKQMRSARNSSDPLLDLTITILENHFELLEKGRPDALLKAVAKDKTCTLTLSLEEAEEVFVLIRDLEPFPGRAFDNSPPSYVAPDVLVRKQEDGEGYSVIINDEEIPVLGVSPFFLELENPAASKNDAAAANGGASDKDTALSAEAAAGRDFASESLKEARWFINSISRRNHTILKVARIILLSQRAFFDFGPSRMAPLRLKDVASEIGMHEATVSRATRGKYLQCEWGLFELSYFFSNRVGGVSSGTTVTATIPGGQAGGLSKEAVKEMIRKIVAESKESLSDQKISTILAERGISIARRTVAKYRNELTIGSSFER